MTTATPPGTCLIHGYHGMTTCPSCSTAIPQPLTPAPLPQGWQCPQCKRVLSPSVLTCPYHLPEPTP